MMNTPLEQILKKLNACSKSALLEYAMEYVQDKVNFRFFSYGSNMNEEKFRKDMKKAGKEIGLINVSKRKLSGFKRTLSNKSKRHGIAFSIYRSIGAEVEGICHDIPIEALEAFLKKEGLLQRIPSYKLIMVSVADEDEPILTLLGLKPVLLEQLSRGDRKKAMSYLNECIKGAKHFEVEHSDMLEARDVLKDQ